MKPFPNMPKVTEKDRHRILESGYIDSWNKLDRLCREQGVPSIDDIKKMILIECERDQPRESIIERLIVKLQKQERLEIIDVINTTKNLKLRPAL
jgi:hypothetical protein